MEDIMWEAYIPEQGRRSIQSLPQITLIRDLGRIMINPTAYSLISNVSNNQYAEFYLGFDNEKIRKMRLCFSNEKNYKSVPISRSHYTSDIVLQSKTLVDEIFSAYPSWENTCTFLAGSQIIDGISFLVLDFSESLLK